MAGISIETTLELWASSLREIKARIRPLFTQARVAASAGLFLDGLLGPERRKTGWMRARCAVSEKVGAVWGIGPDGEMASMWKPTAQKGLWFMAGGLAQCRIYSKHLALQIKAREEALIPG